MGLACVCVCVSLWRLFFIFDSLLNFQHLRHTHIYIGGQCFMCKRNVQRVLGWKTRRNWLTSSVRREFIPSSLFRNSSMCVRVRGSYFFVAPNRHKHTHTGLQSLFEPWVWFHPKGTRSQTRKQRWLKRSFPSFYSLQDRAISLQTFVLRLAQHSPPHNPLLTDFLPAHWLPPDWRARDGRSVAMRAFAFGERFDSFFLAHASLVW